MKQARLLLQLIGTVRKINTRTVLRHCLLMYPPYHLSKVRAIVGNRLVSLRMKIANWRRGSIRALSEP